MRRYGTRVEQVSATHFSLDLLPAELTRIVVAYIHPVDFSRLLLSIRSILNALWRNHEVEFATWHLKQLATQGPMIAGTKELVERFRRVPFQSLPLAYALGFLSWKGVTSLSACCLAPDTFKWPALADFDEKKTWPSPEDLERPYGNPKWIERVLWRAVELKLVPFFAPPVERFGLVGHELAGWQRLALALDCADLLQMALSNWDSYLSVDPPYPRDHYVEEAGNFASGFGSSRCVALILSDPQWKWYIEDLKDWIYEASNFGHVETVMMLLSVDFDDKNFDERRKEVLADAVACGEFALVEELLNHGVDASHQMDFSEYPHGKFTMLHVATYEQDEDMARLLLRHGADVNARTERSDECHWTPLHLACHQNNSSMIRMLVTEWKADMDARDSDHRTPLMLATSYRSREAVKTLISLGAELLAKDHEGDDAICYANDQATDEVLLEARAWLLYFWNPPWPERSFKGFLLELEERAGGEEKREVLREAIESVRKRLPFWTPTPEEWK
ncbi:Ankyrin repeat and EF-hand domain-containing protein 1 [Phlyctochytrium bullatum]|nr:Ankyrin repeat and EF-hand domain-containing protein 1 [Phlyctochytrium bullatum]